MNSLDAGYLSGLAFKAEVLSIVTQVGRYHGQQALYARQAPEMWAALRHHAIIESSESEGSRFES